ncbi:MAG: glycoside hydrolase family 9 protein [Eubacterium sp.]|nr:glycoside hydrolase family 9 protein [Eubacterium sp.]
MRIKRLIAYTLIGAMVLSTAGCGATNTDSEKTEAVTEEPTSEDDIYVEDEGEESTVESGLKGTGPYTLEETFAADDSADMSLNAGDVVAEINFDDGDIDGFCVYNNGGYCEISNEDNKLKIAIDHCGTLDYSNQVYWDGFALNQNCVYTYSFDISSDIERKVEYRLQINGGDYHAYHGELIDVGPDPISFSTDFQMTEGSDPAPRIVFNMGFMEGMTAEPGPHNVYIDNIKLVVKDASEAIELSGLPNYVNVAVDQLGYKPDDSKIAVVKTDNEGDEEFIVCDAATNETVYSGMLEAPIADEGALINVRKADFSEFNTPGEYYVYTAEGASYTFKIEDDPYSEVYKDSIRMLYMQRCGTATDATIAGDFKHDECHSAEATVYDNRSKKKEVSGGWHDAGDYGRYVVPGAVTVMDLFEAYEDFDASADDVGIPESGNGIPDILDEARYELDWMLKMQDEASGGVYHKVTALVFPETVGPEEELAELFLCPVSVTATADFAAVMAKASMVYKDIDPTFAENAAKASEKAWDYLMANTEWEGYTNPEDVETGEYPDTKIQDEIYWAAVEMYLTGHDDAKSYITEYGSDEMMIAGLGWADIATYADYELAKYASEDLKDIGISRITAAADQIKDRADKSGYFMGFETGYSWGSNLRVGNNGEILYMAANVTGDDTYSSLGRKQLDYLFGTNPLGYCFVTGYGTLSPQNPHHRPSQVVGSAMPGMLVGGPDKNLEDPYAQAVLFEQAPSMCYADNAQSFSTNEIAIYWNSPLIYLLSAAEK